MSEWKWLTTNTPVLITVAPLKSENERQEYFSGGLMQELQTCGLRGIPTNSVIWKLAICSLINYSFPVTFFFIKPELED